MADTHIPNQVPAAGIVGCGSRWKRVCEVRTGLSPNSVLKTEDNDNLTEYFIPVKEIQLTVFD